MHSLVRTWVALHGTADGFVTGTASFQWTQTAGPSVTLSDAAAASPGFRPRRVGVYTFSLVATVEGRASTPDTVDILVHDINGGESFTVALKPDGTLLAWGLNSEGQLGIGMVDTALHAVPQPVCAPGETDCMAHPFTGVVAISTGRSHVLALKADGTVWAWGANFNNPLGDGTANPRPSPGPVCDVGAVDCTAQPLGNVVAVTAGYEHSMALRTDGTVVGWGYNGDGAVGVGSSTSRVASPMPACAVGQVDPCTTAETQLGNIVQLVAGGGGHTLALTSLGGVLAFGYNKSGQCGIGVSDLNSKKVFVPQPVCAEGGVAPCTTFLTGMVNLDAWSGHSLALDAAGQLWGWGGNDEGELSMVTTATCFSGNSCGVAPAMVCSSRDAPCTMPMDHVVAFAAGRRFSLALQDNAQVYAWGNNAAGQLGDGTILPAMPPVHAVCAPGTMAPDCAPLAGISAVTAGNFQALALGKTGALYVWGDGANGQLGTGNEDVLSIPVQLTPY